MSGNATRQGTFRTRLQHRHGAVRGRGWTALLALLISHGVSFACNFIGRREYHNKTSQEQMSEPYQRIVIMHVTLIAGGGLSLLLDSPVAALLLLVMLKIATDIHAHR